MSNTQKPWRYAIDKVYGDSSDHHCVVVDREEFEIIALCGYVGDGNDKESVANAHLIAAAPDLFEALEEARDLLVLFAGQYPEADAAFKKAHQAIAKARGEK